MKHTYVHQSIKGGIKATPSISSPADSPNERPVHVVIPSPGSCVHQGITTMWSQDNRLICLVQHNGYLRVHSSLLLLLWFQMQDHTLQADCIPPLSVNIDLCTTWIALQACMAIPNSWQSLRFQWLCQITNLVTLKKKVLFLASSWALQSEFGCSISGSPLSTNQIWFSTSQMTTLLISTLWVVAGNCCLVSAADTINLCLFT